MSTIIACHGYTRTDPGDGRQSLSSSRIPFAFQLQRTAAHSYYNIIIVIRKWCTISKTNGRSIKRRAFSGQHLERTAYDFIPRLIPLNGDIIINNVINESYRTVSSARDLRVENVFIRWRSIICSDSSTARRTDIQGKQLFFPYRPATNKTTNDRRFLFHCRIFRSLVISERVWKERFTNFWNGFQRE